MNNKTEVVDKLEMFLIDNKNIKLETMKEIYPFLKEIKKQLSIHGVVKSLNFLDTSKTKQQRSYYVDKRGRYIHKTGKEIKGQELKILKELEAEGKF